jgi:hypothetical protein
MARWALPAAQVPSDSSPDEWKVPSSTTRLAPDISSPNPSGQTARQGA